MEISRSIQYHRVIVVRAEENVYHVECLIMMSFCMGMERRQRMIKDSQLPDDDGVEESRANKTARDVKRESC